MRLPVSSLSLPSPTANTLPFWGFSFAVSGRTIPEAVVASSSTALTITRSPSGLSFIKRRLQWAREKGALALAIRECQALPTIPRRLALAENIDGRRKVRVPNARAPRPPPLASIPHEACSGRVLALRGLVEGWCVRRGCGWPRAVVVMAVVGGVLSVVRAGVITAAGGASSSSGALGRSAWRGQRG